jgi:hypothetical protein
MAAARALPSGASSARSRVEKRLRRPRTASAAAAAFQRYDEHLAQVGREILGEQRRPVEVAQVGEVLRDRPHGQLVGCGAVDL